MKCGFTSIVQYVSLSSNLPLPLTPELVYTYFGRWCELDETILCAGAGVRVEEAEVRDC